MSIRTAATATFSCLLSMSCVATAIAQSAPAADEAAAPAGGAQQDGAGAGLAEVTVTAQKHRESAQEVPLAISALSADALAATGTTSVQALSTAVPNLSIGEQFGQVQIGLRGISVTNLSAGAESSIALNKNDVYISRPVGALDSFFDIDRVEVLRGPQGTLQGRNATGGAINIYTRAPSNDFSGYGEVSLGNYDDIRAEGALNAPLVADTLLLRLAFVEETRGGYGINEVNRDPIDNLNEAGIRATLLYLPSERVTVKLIADYHHEQDNSGGYHFGGAAGLTASGTPLTPTGELFGGSFAVDPRDVSNNQDPTYRQMDGNFTADVGVDLSDALRFRSISAYQYVFYRADTDLDGTSADITGLLGQERSSQATQEFQLTGHSEVADWVTGLYYFHEHDYAFLALSPLNALPLGGPNELFQGYFGGGPFNTDAGAVFGQYTRKLLPQLSLTLGGRYSIERKEYTDNQSYDVTTPYNPAVDGPYAGNVVCGPANADPPKCVPSKTWSAFTPRVALEYQAAPDVLFYASYNKGFKSGTFNLEASTAVNPPVAPETIQAYELGLKSEFLQNRLRLNLASFYYQYDNLQEDKVVGPSLVLENAASSEIYGAELELQARPTPQWQFGFNASWLHARFINFVSIDPSRPGGDGRTLDNGAPAFNLAGNTLPRSPDYTASLWTEYTIPVRHGALTLRGDVTETDRTYFDAFNRTIDSQPAFTMVDASIGYELTSWTLSAYCRNATNALVRTSGFISSGLAGFIVNDYLAPPRTFGVKASYKF